MSYWANGKRDCWSEGVALKRFIRTAECPGIGPWHQIGLGGFPEGL